MEDWSPERSAVISPALFDGFTPLLHQGGGREGPSRLPLLGWCPSSACSTAHYWRPSFGCVTLDEVGWAVDSMLLLAPLLPPGPSTCCPKARECRRWQECFNSLFTPRQTQDRAGSRQADPGSEANCNPE
ncbi:UNVERIFIED_CONTAM: hypothetical protein K2H54_031525 [Gekko kuhli]